MIATGKLQLFYLSMLKFDVTFNKYFHLFLGFFLITDDACFVTNVQSTTTQTPRYLEFYSQNI